MSLSYFASDGNYGDASDILLLDTSDWDAADWSDIDASPDNEKRDTALFIAWTRR